MSKTGFSNGFADVPTRKYYKYHGLVRECNTEPVLPPYLQFPNYPPGPRWEVIYEAFNTTDQTYSLVYDIGDFLPANLNDICSIKFSDGKMRHYFCELEIWDGTFIVGWGMDLNGIVMCSVTCKAGDWSYYYKSYTATIWAGKPFLVWIYQWVPNSHFKIWRSSTGVKPSYDPVPIQEYHIV